MNSLDVRCFIGLTGLLQLKPAWQQLFTSCLNPSFYNDWRWHYAIQKHLFDHDIHYFAVYDAEVLVAIVPLTTDIRHRQGLRVVHLDFPRHQALDCADMVVREGRANPIILQAVLDHIKRHRLLKWDLLRLSLFSDRSATFAIVKDTRTEPGALSAHAQRHGGADILASVSKKQVRNVRRCLKQAESRYGKVHFLGASSPEEIDQAYSLFLDIEASGWKGQEGSAIRLRQDVRAFYKEALNSFADTGQAVVNVLDFAGKPAAAQIGIQTPQKLSLLKIGYDEAFRDLGPGGIALLKCLEELPSELPEVTLVTNPPWAERWHFACETLWHTMYFNTTLYGQTLRLLRTSRTLLRKTLGKGE